MRVFKDIMNAPERWDFEPGVNRWEYLLCLITWAISLAAIPVLTLLGLDTVKYYYFIPMFPLIILCGAVTGVVEKGKDHSPYGMRRGFDVFVFIVWIVSVVLFVGFLLVTMYYGGSPTAKAGGYVIVSHNIEQRTITEKEYRILNALFGTGEAASLCSFTSYILLKARRVLKK